ncbi:hypothetical protein HY798_03185 [Candidatus Falkowbacteria bacterium]|nr:hypothetical protein [Candidatus Falkowbacteria bacterium]
MNLTKDQVIWGLLRLGMGWIFFWAFIDKVFGLGFATASGKGWLDGGSPTFGFLKFATHGPLAGIYQSMAGNPVVDWLFMIGLLLIGLALLLGMGVKIAGYSGALMLVLMYTAGFMPPVHNPFLDDHIINAIIMIGLTVVDAGSWLGFGRWWGNTKIVQRFGWLK